MSQTPNPPAGWYPDPDAPESGRTRYWDGVAWASAGGPSGRAYPTVSAGHGGVKVPNYLAWSIINLLCLCLPFGIVALVYSVKANSTQDPALANKAKQFNIVASVGGAIFLVVYYLMKVKGGTA
jgi:uncharacterized membrane protein YjfL (UPF0719 family)